MPRGLRPRTPTYFSLVGKIGNTHPGHLSTHREGTLSMGSLPYVPHPHDDTKGARPLWIPPSQSCGLPGDPDRFDLRGGNEFRLAPRFSPLAKTLVRRTPGGQSLRGASTVEQRDWRICGGFQRGRAPFVSSRKRGSRGRNPIERVSPPVRFFGHFLSAQKVTRGSGAELPRGFGKKHVSFPPARRYTNLSPSARCAGTAPSKK